MKALLLLVTLLSSSYAMAVDLDLFVDQQGEYLFNGKKTSSDSYAKIEKEDVFVTPLNQTMVRYIFRSHFNPSRPELALFTMYRDSAGQYYSYMKDQAYLPSADQSFQNLSASSFNDNQWVSVKASGNTLEGVFYPGDLGEVKFKFEIKEDSILIHTWVWDIWFGMIPLPRHDVNEFRF